MEAIQLSALHLTAIIRKEDNMYTSWCPEIDIASQGNTKEKAIANLKEAIELCLENDQSRDQIIGDLGDLARNCPDLCCLEIDALKKF